jgi:hypothetical protein
MIVMGCNVQSNIRTHKDGSISWRASATSKWHTHQRGISYNEASGMISADRDRLMAHMRSHGWKDNHIDMWFDPNF